MKLLIKKTYFKESILIKKIVFCVLVLSIFLVISIKQSKASNNEDLQLRIGDSVSIYSEKAYRRDGGTFFEAVGNVVISSGKDTLYGESASINTKTGKVIIEGSVRFIGKSLTLYGSKITYDMKAGQLEMKNARMITPDFSVVATYLLKKSDTLYYATEAEFTTCRDCAESWKIMGKEIDLEIGQYVRVRHALMKVKGVDVLYFPYLILPIKNNRESGFLFPLITTENDEGISYKQPIFWNISDSEDATFTPEFLANRGQGLEFQYRKVIGEKKWVELNNKVINDKIYFPEKLNNNSSGKTFFRQFFEFESHYQTDLKTNHHLHLMGVKDLDFIGDFDYYTKDYDQSSDLGLSYTGEKRFDTFSIGLESHYKRNLITDDALNFDSNYVQILPKVNFSVMPHLLFQSDSNFFYKMLFGVDADWTLFRQNRFNEEDGVLRNAIRFDTKPYVELSILNYGPFYLKSKYSVDYQEYKFLEEDQKKFYKNAGLVSTELQFSVDRIFGLAYEEKYSKDELLDSDFKKISKQDNQNTKNAMSKRIIGKLPKMEKARTKEIVTVKKNSYRHSQDFKVIHHQLIHEGESGNDLFSEQIKQEEGWFDYQDAVRANILELESNEARINIPLNNTLELQWNNSLVKKSTKYFDYLVDHKYLKDNFTYHKLGHFNVSQGFLLEGNNENFKNSLTRLHLDASYNTGLWYVNFDDYYNHQSNDHILSFSGERKFDKINLLGQYSYNSYSDTNLKTIKTGFQFRPIDVFGFSFLREFDLESDKNISSIYQVDLMPHNNCWILNLKFQENSDNKVFSFQFKFNYGNEEFKEYKRDFFSFSRFQ